MITHPNERTLMTRKISFIALALMVLPSCGGEADRVSRAESALTTTMEVTAYGYPDNDPAGTAIAYPHSSYPAAIHEHAGGTGTLADPLTMASDTRWVPIGTIMYVPMIKKYVVMEDYCQECIDDWDNQIKHIDIWMPSDSTTLSGSNYTALMNCEDFWTRCMNGEFCTGGSGTSVITSAGSGCTVDATPTFNLSTHTCWSGSGTGSCGGGSGGLSVPSSVPYSGVDWWADIFVSNSGSTGISSWHVTFTVPSGVTCQVGTAGFSVSQSGTTCTYSTTTQTVAPGTDTYDLGITTDNNTNWTLTNVSVASP